MGEKITIVGIIAVSVVVIIAAFSVAVVMLTNSGDREQAVRESTAMGNAAADPTEYPLSWCLVSGEDLSCREAPISQEYNGQVFQFCCNQCVAAFRHDPGFYLERLMSLENEETDTEAARTRALQLGRALLGW